VLDEMVGVEVEGDRERPWGRCRGCCAMVAGRPFWSSTNGMRNIGYFRRRSRCMVDSYKIGECEERCFLRGRFSAR